MNILDENGDYVSVPGTRRLARSNHPVYQARNEVALGQGKWLHAPKAGHQLERFSRMDQTPANVVEFQKELAFYLSRYSPAVQTTFVDRPGVDFNLNIPSGALNGV